MAMPFAPRAVDWEPRAIVEAPEAMFDWPKASALVFDALFPSPTATLPPFAPLAVLL
jgi:hypothetical protein